MKYRIFSFTSILFLLLQSSFAQNYVSTYSGGGTAGLVNGNLDTARFNTPFGMCIDKDNNLYITDGGNNVIRKVNTGTGIVTTLAGTGVAGWHDGPADSARFNEPSDLCVDDSGNVYVSDFTNQRIRKISVSGIVTTIAGSGTAGYLDAFGTIARFNYPRGICIDANYNLYVGDSWNHRIRKIDPSGSVTTYAGGGTAMGVSSVGALVDAADTAARFFTPAGLAIDQHGNVFVADAYNHRIRRIDTLRVVTTVAGSGPIGMGMGGYMNGPSASAQFNTPTELFVDSSNNKLYISDTFNNRIRFLDMSTDTVGLYAGNGIASQVDGPAAIATFNFPRGIVVASNIDKVYVADYVNNAIRLITSQATSVQNIHNDRIEITISPNPSNGIFTISEGNRKINRIEIFNSSGMKIMEVKSNHVPLLKVDLSPFSDGIYILQIVNEDGMMMTKKLMKRK